MDDIMFKLYRGTNGPESSTTLRSEGVRQVAVPVGRVYIYEFISQQQSYTIKRKAKKRLPNLNYIAH